MRIILVSDTHLAACAKSFVENWKACRRWIENQNPDMVIHLGDITVDGADNPDQLELALSCFSGFEFPVHFLPGNHDIGDNPAAPGMYAHDQVDAVRLEQYRNCFGPDRWSFDRGAWQIVALNAQLFGTGKQEEEGQYDWLNKELFRSDALLGLMLHKPLFRNGPADVEAHDRYIPVQSVQRLLAMLSARKLKFIVSGHVHQARHTHIDGVDHIWAPSTSFCIPDGIQERIGRKIVGLTMLELGGQDYRFGFETPPGLQRHNLLDFPQIYPQLENIIRIQGYEALPQND